MESLHSAYWMLSRPTLLDFSYFLQLPKYQDFWSISSQIKGFVFRWLSAIFHRKTDGKVITGILHYCAVYLVCFGIVLLPFV